MTLFEQQVYEIVKRIPEGKVATYGDIAKALGDRNMCRAVGNAMHKNPLAFTPENLGSHRKEELVPCHRVVNAAGKLSRNFGYKGLEGQTALLQAEAVTIQDGAVDLSVRRFPFTQE